MQILRWPQLSLNSLLTIQPTHTVNALPTYLLLHTTTAAPMVTLAFCWHVLRPDKLLSTSCKPPPPPPFS